MPHNIPYNLGFSGGSIGGSEMNGKKAKNLTALFVKNIKERGRYSDNLNNLYLQVKPSGLKSWIFRYSIHGARREMGLGRTENLTLEQARKKASDFYQQKKDIPSFDPIAERKQQQINSRLEQNRAKTFADCAEEFISLKKCEWTNPKHAQQWTNTLKTYAYPTIGSMPLKSISTEHIRKLLMPIWTTKTETATRVCNRIKQVLDYSLAHKYHEGENVARWPGHLDKMLPKPAKIKKVKHHPALPYKDIHTFTGELREHKTMSAYALEFLILTASRTGSVINATWDEINLKEGLWQIPAEKMKTKKPHEVPLNNRAMELINFLHDNKINNFIFAGQSKGGGLSNAAMDKLLQKTMCYPQYTVHGFRSCFRDWIGEETDTPNHVAEMALAHTIKNSAEAAYRRGDLIEKRRVLMDKWLEYINRPIGDGQVIPFKKIAVNE